MPTRVLVVGATAYTKLPQNPLRTVLSIQNLDTVSTDYIWVSDEPNPLITGHRIEGNGGQITLRKVDGEEPEKEWYIQATAASTPIRVLELYGTVGNGGAPPVPPPSNGAPPSNGEPPTSSCIASAVIPFQPVLNVFRHIRSYLPMSWIRFYYRIPYWKCRIRGVEL